MVKDFHSRRTMESTHITGTALQYDQSPTASITKLALSGDTIINLAFGVLMAILGLVTIYQAARFAARHAHHTFSNQGHTHVADVEMPTVDDANAQASTDLDIVPREASSAHAIDADAEPAQQEPGTQDARPMTPS